MNSEVHRNTPGLTVIDGRGLPVRTVAYYCLVPGVEPESRITRTVYDALGHLVSLSDPRLGPPYEQETLTPNRVHVYSLSGIPVLSESVDGGWNLGLCAEAGNVIESWDGRGSSWQTRFDSFLRPIATLETTADGVTRTIDRRFYSDNSSDAIEHNQCAQVIRIDDTAGSLLFPDYGLFEQPLYETRHFLKAIEIPDWSGVEDFQDLVEPDGMTTRWSYSAAGDCVHEIDACHNRKRNTYTVAGQLDGVYLQLAGATEHRLLERITYNAQGQVQEQTARNGVTSQRLYGASDSRIDSLTVSKAGRPLQALHYRYDPVGNIVQMADNAQATRYFANQRIEPINYYAYDSLYQLTQASGREAANASNSAQLPDVTFNPGDASQLLNYTEDYQYDAGGNLLRLRHQREGNNYTRSYEVAPHSNRALPLPDNGGEPDFNSHFDSNGNLQLSQPGQHLTWDARNQLCTVTLLDREDGNNDEERYVYDGGGQRARKVRTSLAKGRVIIDEVRYLPGLEIRLTQAGLADEGRLEVSKVLAGDFNVRCLHWAHGKPDEIERDQVRYGLDDLLGSITLELDADGDFISYEGYYPYGGTAWWAARSVVQAKYKTIRYSGKEQDASGLYFYGFRYYAPWLQRWINPDPSGDIDGLNLYRMAGNNPVTYRDTDGRIKGVLDAVITQRRKDAKAPLRENPHGKLVHKIMVHQDVLGLIEGNAEAVGKQLRNYASTKRLASSAAQRVGVIAAKTSISVATAAGGAVLGGVFLGAVTGGMGAAVGAVAGAAALGPAAGIAIEKVAETFNLTAPLDIRPDALNPDRLFDIAENTAGSLLNVVMAKANDFNPLTKKGRHALRDAGLSSALAQVPEVGGILKSGPDAYHILKEVHTSKKEVDEDTFTEIITNIDTLQTRLKSSLDELNDLFIKARSNGISFIPGITHNLKSLTTDTEQVIDVLVSTQYLASSAKKGNVRRSATRLQVTRL